MNHFAQLNKQYIGGEWKDGHGQNVLTDKNPYNGEIVAEFRIANLQDIDEAYQAAAHAKEEWDKVNPFTKRAVLERAIAYIEQHEKEITEIIMDELGGTRLKAAFEIGLVKDIIKEAATFPLRMEGKILPSPVDGKENRLYRLPVGVVGVISPFNFPFYLSMKSVAPALGAGNGVVLKPHEDTPITGGTLIAKIFEEAGIPKGLLNVVVTEISEIGDAFVEHPIPRVISFTGSTQVGSHIGQLAAKHFKKAALELGGNSALIVLEDADIDYAVNAAVFSRFTHQGQVCMSANRVIVHQDVYDEFVTKYVNKVSTLKCGNPREEDTIIGPLINKRQVQNLIATVEEGIREGATPILHGDVRGNVVEPIVLSDVTTDMAVAKRELFGPAVCIMKFSTEEEAIRMANDTPFGLSGAVHTANLERGAEFAKKVYTGMIHVNDGTINDEPLVAFGGEKNSGLGRLNGPWSLEEFTTLKWISIQHTPRQFPY
ncbi:aldehyde dehydrogenase family protein [Aneurinibacillus aneurinilyticus]|jgi:aldehyde dehydrogenase (NAD+)|uniref:Putative benzaldehyde dehydrogenase AreC n=1 Tax=Aneurinibacillus aneurinilyticus ATCC 12856 TaxID=649747 RepID=U1Y9M5_ANEAE|nr:aldehyde dehydrogenase family protein [Aneurinibacillus aneurinilyticus]ERI08837.1 putative benzaldehyde dehydrogenase AreC [Aneurinibacillus aneurinilyticus ATCC 12856]MCI1695015.1 aldehyde dehydrogenase family protein [Aneurinibacillus aneurinilyticus]MED0706672.1 aldehyde dehydrogenase family protein [Aneurinibacillus aneurinilyticus]MED0723565.1 aldehyde dehydrogenase family protein [Aneurinibacillus aneurinilyticus]MED0731687.1 aldehyde dehydrogenase family protein [Aneurinibacillus an